MPSVLVISPVLPYPPDRGNKRRILEVLTHLAEQGFGVDLLQLLEEDGRPWVESAEQHLGRLCRKVYTVRHMRISELRRLRMLQNRLSAHGHSMMAVEDWITNPPNFRLAAWRLLRTHHYDACLVNYAKLGSCIRGAPRRTLRVVDTMDVYYVLLKRLMRLSDPTFEPGEELRQQEITLLDRFDVVLGVSEVDTDYFRAYLNRARAMTVPITVPIAPQYRPSADDDIVLFMGINRPENADAVRWFLEEVWPRVHTMRPQARFNVVGPVADSLPDPPPPGVIAVGRVPEVMPIVTLATVVVCPVRAGGGVKVKVLEGLAAGRAVVTTPIGAEGTGLVDGETAFIAAEPARLADHILTLLARPDLRHRMERQGYEHMQARYSPKVAYAPLVEVLRRGIRVRREGLHREAAT